MVVLIDVTSVLNRNTEAATKPVLIEINIRIVLVDIVFADGFFDLKTAFLLVLVDLLLLTFAKSFVYLHFLHWSYSKKIQAV